MMTISTSQDINRRSLARTAAAGLLGAMLAPFSASAAPGAFSLSIVPGVVTAAADILRKEYVDPPAANRMADMLVENFKAGAYNAVQSPTALAARLTADLRGATNDLHMQISYDPPNPAQDTARDLPEDELHPRTTAFGIQTVARLPGNVGLLRITHFPSPPTVFAVRYGAAMELLQTTAAMILDLTVNHGGGSDTMGFFMSYFLDGEIELGRIAWRNEPVEIVKTSNAVPGPRYGEQRPLYIAVSKRTFSAGEAIAFRLRAHGRAVLVGRPTRGGAHAGNFFKLPNDFRIFVVMGRGEDPDWEGTGVLPDIPAEPEFAVRAAHRLAVQSLLGRSTDAKVSQILQNVLDHSIENLSSFSY